MPAITILDRTITPNHGEDYEKSFCFQVLLLVSRSRFYV
jgi:hypothetical protein